MESTEDQSGMTGPLNRLNSNNLWTVKDPETWNTLEYDIFHKMIIQMNLYLYIFEKKNV